MKNVLALTKRNCLLFLRSKSTVFFSFFSSLILIVLYFLFIAKLYSQGFNEAANTALSSKQLNFAIYSQMIMGVLVINSVSLPVGMFMFMAKDLETRKTEALLLTKAKPVELVLSYLISSLLLAFTLNFMMLLLSVIIIGVSTTYWLSVGTFFMLVLALIVTTFISCSVVLLITAIVRSSAAIGVANGVLGTLLGFLCGIYMPYSNMGVAAKQIGSLLPFTHLTIWLKQIALTDVFNQFGMPIEVSKAMQETWFSAGNVGLLGANIPLWVMLLLSGVFAVICLVVSILILKTKLKNTGERKIASVNKKRKI